MEAENRQNALAETERQFVNATMVQAKTHVPGAITAGRKLPLPDRLRQFVKFCLVGGSGVLVDMGVLYVLADPKTLAVNLAFSKVCAAEIALVNNFLWNELWTFRTLSHPMGEGRGEGFPRLRWFLFFNAICGIGILFAVLVLHLFHTLLGWNLYLSNLLTIALVTLWNFGMNVRFNWATPSLEGTNRI